MPDALPLLQNACHGLVMVTQPFQNAKGVKQKVEKAKGHLKYYSAVFTRKTIR